MTTYPAIRNSERCPTHPGALLRDEVIPATGRTKTNIARLLGISRQHLHDILEERKPVSAEVAVRLVQAVWQRRRPLLQDAGRARFVEGQSERRRFRHSNLVRRVDGFRRNACDQVRPEIFDANDFGYRRRRSRSRKSDRQGTAKDKTRRLDGDVPPRRP